MMLNQFTRGVSGVLVLLGAMMIAPGPAFGADARPNILWIVVEDASPHVGCYGETTIDTPHIDAMADRGVRFTDAIVTSPVCSPSRSAMVTGMYQTTLGGAQPPLAAPARQAVSL